MPREPSWWYRAPGLTAQLLSPLASIYGAVAARRMVQTDAYRSALPVICVGNFTAGGSGKTPFTSMLAERLAARGERPAILTRGYGGSTHGPHWVDPATDTAAAVGDEPLLLARIAPTLVARDRQAGARAIEERAAASVIVMDDGFQNGALVKDLSFAIVDGPRGLGNGCVIPAGPLRVPLAVQGGKADAIILNGAGATALLETLTRASQAPLLFARLDPVGDMAWLSGTRIVAFAGIGNPARFFDTLSALGANLAETVSFPDHAAFTDADSDRLLGLAKRHGARLITTQKDHIRLQGSGKREALAAATAVLPVRMVLGHEDQQRLDRLLDRTLKRR